MLIIIITLYCFITIKGNFGSQMCDLTVTLNIVKKLNTGLAEVRQRSTLTKREWMIAFGMLYCSALPYDISTLLINNHGDLMILNSPKIHLKTQNEIYLYVYPLKTPFMTKEKLLFVWFFLVIRTISEIMTVWHRVMNFLLSFHSS